MNKKRDLLDGYKLIPYHTFKRGDLVRVKDFARDMAGMLGIVLSREDYNTACKVVLSNGKERTIMKFCLERVDAEED
tara:strand:+ start:976 stop:1206 length:231 start_codon:yes stop_codon:yes gene_type:complete